MDGWIYGILDRDIALGMKGYIGRDILYDIRRGPTDDDDDDEQQMKRETERDREVESDGSLKEKKKIEKKDMLWTDGRTNFVQKRRILFFGG